MSAIGGKADIAVASQNVRRTLASISCCGSEADFGTVRARPADPRCVECPGRGIPHAITET